jgi:ribosomal-protein-alanine N-acetyltransferase
VSDLRAATVADLDALVALDAALFGANAWSRTAMSAELATAGRPRLVLVAVRDDALVGLGVLLTVADSAELLRLGVAGEHQRAGVGSALLAALVARSVAARCGQLTLEVAADNAPARLFYERHGFVGIGRRPRYYPDGTAAVVMRLDLAPLADGPPRYSCPE